MQAVVKNSIKNFSLLHFVRSRDERFFEIEIHKTVQNILKLIDYWVVVMGVVKTGVLNNNPP